MKFTIWLSLYTALLFIKKKLNVSFNLIDLYQRRLFLITVISSQLFRGMQVENSGGAVFNANMKLIHVLRICF